MTTTELNDPLGLLRAKLLTQEVIIGKERVLKALQQGKLSAVLLAHNCPETMRTDVEYYAKLTKTPFVVLEQNNEEMGILCKKNFLISIVGVVAA